MGSFGVGGIYPEKGSITWKAAGVGFRIGKKLKRPLRMRLDDRENKPALKSGFDKACGIDHARITRRTGQIPGSARDAFLVGDGPRRGLIPPLAMCMQDAWCGRNQRRVRRRRFARTFRE